MLKTKEDKPDKTMYSIKSRPEDFVVEEILDVEKLGSGWFFIFKLLKKNLTTERAIELICERFNIKKKQAGFCGNKDKVAITTQYVSLPKNVKEFSTESLSLKFVSGNKERLTLGRHEKNRFKIIVRNLEKKNYNKSKVFPNYFGPQRFSKNNFEVGLAILKKEHGKACSLIDDEKVKYYLQKHPGDYTDALRKSNVKFFIHSFQ